MNRIPIVFAPPSIIDERKPMPDTEDVTRLKNSARTAAETRLREAHKEELGKYMQAEYEKRGLEWKPRLTKLDAARAQVAALMNEYGLEVLPNKYRGTEDVPLFPEMEES
jgi:hypothetical protein